ncbi:ABC transporter ATP-binding protein [Bacillus timonensis]|nr:ABC transporter ATP-binding protein [Bacillus timonensis]
MKPIVQLTNITKYYRKKKAVEAISFTIEGGQIYGLLGPNGAGKTTTINILCGDIKQTEGTVTIVGKDPRKQSIAIKKEIGIVPDADEMIDDITAMEYLLFVAAIRKLNKKEVLKEIENWLVSLNLWDSRNHLLKSYSHGMRKKIQIISALLHKPKLIIIDEPTNGLDPSMITLLKSIFITLKNKGLTILLTTHHLSFANDVCDEICLINNGRCLAKGTVQHILEYSNTSNLEQAYVSITHSGLKVGDVNELLESWKFSS